MGHQVYVTILAIAVLPAVTASDSGPMSSANLLKTQEVAKILQDITKPFAEIKEKRNEILDALMTSVIENFDPIIPAANALNRTLADMAQKLPEIELTLYPALGSTLAFIDESLSKMERVLDRCPLTLTVLPIGMPSLAHIQGILNSILGAFRTAGGSVMATKTEIEKEEEAKTRSDGNDIQLGKKEEYVLGGVAMEPMNQVLLTKIGKPVTCDEKCQMEKIGEDNAKKHVLLDDVVRAFAQVVGAAMEKHRQRYLKLLPVIEKAGNDLNRMSNIFRDIVKQVQILDNPGQNMTSKATQILSTNMKYGQRLRKIANRLKC